MNVEETLETHAHWLLRGILAAIFLYHGLTKLPQLELAAQFFEVPVGLFAVVAVLETSGAVLVFLGGFVGRSVTRLGVVLLAPVMIGAIALVHWPRWTFAPSESHPLGGMEFQLTLLVIMAFLAFYVDEDRERVSA